MSTYEVPAPPQAVRVQGRLEEPLSRWLWLVKWLLLIPHYIVLVFLWVAFAVVTVVAFFAILFTGRYPRGLFDFNLGVLRWSWRVELLRLQRARHRPVPAVQPRREEPDYPATLDIAYPERLSRGLVLVKWWLLAIPQYIVLGIIVGGAGWTVTDRDHGGDATTWTTPPARPARPARRSSPASRCCSPAATRAACSTSSWGSTAGCCGSSPTSR